jgi:hypothetical protein
MSLSCKIANRLYYFHLLQRIIIIPKTSTMKSYIFFMLIALGLVSSCKQGNSSSLGGLSSVLPSSTGGADEIMFILPDNLYTSATKKAISNEFNKEYRILPQPELKFNISKVEYSMVNSLMYRFRNIVLLANTSNESAILAMAKEILSEEQFEKLASGKQKTFILRNIWSKPQNVVFIFGNDENDLQANLVSSAPSIMDHIAKTDLDEYKKIAYINGVNGKLNEQWKEYYNIQLNIPTEYKLAENKGSFISLRKEIPKGIIFIFFDIISYSGNVPDVNYGIKMRNERGIFVNSPNENSYMITDSTLGFQFNKTIGDQVIKYETSGLWRMENDYMGGPFINQYIIDEANNRVILLDGFIYAPGENKKKRYMRQLEGIFSTLKLLES